MVKILMASPAYDGKVHVPYAISLAMTCRLLSGYGIQNDVRINISGSLLAAERNRLVKTFLESDSTHMLCLDADLGWSAESVKKLIDYDEPFVAGVYPARKEHCFIFRPVLNEDSSIHQSEKGLLEMEYIPAGFMMIKREVFEAIIAKFPELYFRPKKFDENQEDGHSFFNTEIWEGEFWGEDYYFCRKAREAGYKIWVDPTIQFNHAGMCGSLMNVLTNKKDVSMSDIEKEKQQEN